jgi:flagellar biosynthesis protein FliQ
MKWQELFTEPVREMSTKILSFIPNLLVALVILIVGWIIARVIRALVERVLRLARFDILTERAGINQALLQGQITTNPSGIVGKLFYWIVVLLALVMAIDALGLTVATQLLNELLFYIPNVIAAVFILTLGFFFGGLVRGFVQTLVGGVRAVNPETIGKVAQAAVIIFAVAASLEQLRIATTIITNAFTLLFGALALGLALAFGLGCKDMVKEWVKGLTRK